MIDIQLIDDPVYIKNLFMKEVESPTVFIFGNKVFIFDNDCTDGSVFIHTELKQIGYIDNVVMNYFQVESSKIANDDNLDYSVEFIYREWDGNRNTILDILESLNEFNKTKLFCSERLS